MATSILKPFGFLQIGKLEIHNESLPTHGQGGYYAIKFGPSYGQGVRISLGGYGWQNRPWYRFKVQRYPRTATHFSIGPVTLTIIWRRF